MDIRDKIWYYIRYYGGIVCIVVALVATITGAITSNGILFSRGLPALGIFIFLFLRFARGYQAKEKTDTAPEQEEEKPPKNVRMRL